MEIIRLSGYTELEKVAICKKYLFAKQVQENGLTAENMRISDGVYSEIINR